MRYVLFIALFLSGTYASAEQPTSEAVDRFLEVSGEKAKYAAVAAQLGNMFDRQMEIELKGKQVPDWMKPHMDKARSRLLVVIGNSISWEVIGPDIVRLYQQSLTREDVDAMIAFYSSPAGRSVVEKIPALTQQSMLYAQEQMATMEPQIEIIVNEMKREIEAEVRQRLN